MENYIKKAADAFLVERPYGMRVDYRKKGFVLFNRNLNVLGNAEQTRLEELPLERFNVEEIPLKGEVVEEHAGFTDVFFYTDLTNPYAGYVLNLQKLKAYNRFMFPLAMALNREFQPQRYVHFHQHATGQPDTCIQNQYIESGNVCRCRSRQFR